MSLIYLSPHFDDVALSCGGLVWEQGNKGELVSIWTVCAVEPSAEDFSPFAKELHERWEVVSTFWGNDLDMREAIMDYVRANDGICLWKKPGA